MPFCGPFSDFTHLERFLVRAAVIVGGGGLIFGYDIGVISGTLSSLKDEFSLDFYQEGVVVSILYAGSIIGCIIGGPLCDYLGRWRSIQLQNIIFILGALLTGGAINFNMLIVGRFMVGVASAISGLADVPYLTEISPAEFRGILSGQYEMLVSAGILISFSLDLAFSLFKDGWRLAFLLPGLLAFAQSMALFSLPESPKWLISKENAPKARAALAQIYGEELMNKIDEEERQKQLAAAEDSMQTVSLGYSSNQPAYLQRFAANITNGDPDISASFASPIHDTLVLYEDVEAYRLLIRALACKSVSASARTSFDQNTVQTNPTRMTMSSLTDSNDIYSIQMDFLLTSLVGNTEEQAMISMYKYPIYVLIALQTLAQASGANVVRNYAPTIFEDNGVSEQDALGYNVLLGGVKFLCTLWAVLYMERIGRRTLLLLGIAMVTIGMLLLTIFPHNVLIFMFGCVLIYAGFGFGYGPVPWTLSAEVVPTMIRGRIVAWALVASNVAQLITNFAFLPMVSGMTASGTFAVFLVINIIGFVYVYLFLVETKSLLPHDILAFFHCKYIDGMNALKCRKSPPAGEWAELLQGDLHYPNTPIDANFQRREVKNPMMHNNTL